MKVQIWKKRVGKLGRALGKKDEWRFRIVATNGQVIARDTQGYSRKIDAEATVASLQKSLSEAEVVVLDKKPSNSL